MENPAATLHCSNTRCQAPNSQSNKFCQKCRTPLLKRYLWVIGQGVETLKPGTLVGDRYEVVHHRIFLDTKPGTPPETPQEIPAHLVPYLRLSAYGLHLPQVYGRVAIAPRSNAELWLLEGAAIQETEVNQAQGQLLPELARVWSTAPAERQLYWLWQIATLWQPLSQEGVAASLLQPTLLRVDGSLVRLLELSDANPAPTLPQLGQAWLQLLPGAAPALAPFLQQLCTQLQEGFRSAEPLVALLDQGLKTWGRSHRTYEIFTATDQGPSRAHNEDACYPPTGQVLRSQENALAIVCDGIGGHAGGEVASRLAIETLRAQVDKLSIHPNWDPIALTLDLERAVCTANDVISQQNDRENRSERQRMGTTLVMAQTAAHEIYITHVGDSRVYRVTRQSCYQVTQDDDLASREARLGYTLYRGAVQQPAAGSLVQALGMASSATLHPTVQRFVVDEECIFLLCSDGLSDNDRVEQYWQTTLVPILDGQLDLPTAGARLVEIANTQNGHDNVTVAIVYAQVTSSEAPRQPALSVSQLAASTPVTSSVPTQIAVPSQMKTQRLSPSRPPRRPWGLLFLILILLGLGGGLAYLLLPRAWVEPLLSLRPRPSADPLPASPSPPTPPTPRASASPLEAQAVVQVIGSATRPQGGAVPLLLRRGLPTQDESVLGVIPTGSVLQVISKSPSQQQDWLQLRVCAPGATNTAPPAPIGTTPTPPSQAREFSPATGNSQPAAPRYRPVQQGDSGWVSEAEVLPLINPDFPAALQDRACETPTPARPSPTPKSPPAPSSAKPPN